jgi:hypothetical protein
MKVLLVLIGIALWIGALAVFIYLKNRRAKSFPLVAFLLVSATIFNLALILERYLQVRKDKDIEKWYSEQSSKTSSATPSATPSETPSETPSANKTTQ